jgi:hypothetical protein
MAVAEINTMQEILDAVKHGLASQEREVASDTRVFLVSEVRIGCPEPEVWSVDVTGKQQSRVKGYWGDWLTGGECAEETLYFVYTLDEFEPDNSDDFATVQDGVKAKTYAHRVELGEGWKLWGADGRQITEGSD